MNHSMLKGALQYRDRGLSVIPLSYKGKKPLIPWEEYQERIAQKGEVQEWWSKWPDANIGIVTGEVSGLVVVDVDGEKGLETAKRLGLPEGPTVKTGKGYHHYYHHPGDRKVGNFQKKPGLEGIDLRGDGGYVVAPPSIHPSGETYQWIILLDSMPLPTIPESILTTALTKKTPLTNLFKGVPEGERNNALTRLTGKLLQEGWSLEEVLQFALTWNNNNNPPLAEREVQRTIASIHKAHLKNGQSVPFSFNLIEGVVKTELTRVNADTLQQQARDPNRPSLQFVSLLKRDGFLVRGFSHIIACPPKGGKTTLIAQETLTWGQSGQVLYITEESQLTWEERLKELPSGWQNVDLVFAMGSGRGSIFQIISGGEDDIIIIDTLRLFGIEDENDNALIGRTLSPLIAMCQGQGRTLILVCHTRKMGGDYGQAITGGHALFGLVDVGLEVLRVPNASKRRLIRGWGRIINVPELLYELREGELVALGNPDELELEKVKERFKEALSGNWQKTQELIEAIGSPKPSTPQAIKALESLARTGIAERNPSLDAGHKQGGRGYQWRRATEVV